MFSATDTSRFCLIFANGDLNDGLAVRAALDRFRAVSDRLVVAADGGARHALGLGLTPSVTLGDFDSLSESEVEALRIAGSEIRRFPAHKDETDLELALMLAAERHANPIRVIGGFGDRLDQTMGNVYLLALPVLRGRDARMVGGKQTAWLAFPGETQIDGAVGDTLSLLPLGGDVTGITTDGLDYPLQKESLFFGPARGISNVLATKLAHLTFSQGILLLVHTIGRA